MVNKKVVIIGGGFAGSLAAQRLENDFDVTLIDTKEYFEFTPGILRSIVNPKHVRRIQVLHTHYLKRAKVLVGTVKSIMPEHVVLDRENIRFDYLIVSSGSTYTSPFKEQRVVPATRANHLKHYHEDASHAKKIVVIGGGPVGVELAAELIGKYPRKEITIVHSQDRLMERSNPRSSAYAQKYFHKKGVRVILSERITKINKDICVTDRGTRLDADIIFLCTGIKPNFELLSKFHDVLNDNNQVKVNSHLQINGFKHLFAAGDITAISEEKTAQNAERQAKTIVKNIRAISESQPLHDYESKRTPWVISLGRWNGIFDAGTWSFHGIIPALMKKYVERREMLRKHKL